MTAVAVTSGPRPGVLTWARKNLLSSPLNVVLTLLLGLALGVAALGLFRSIADADFTILRVNMALFVVGGFPRDQLWRVATAFGTMGAMVGLVAGLV